jgi:type IV pilus assembly protein PilO
MAAKFDIKNLPSYAKIILSILPSVALIIIFFLVVYSPKQQEISKLENEISELDNQISTNEAKARRLKDLKEENKKIEEKLSRLKNMLPDEKEVSELLKQLSEYGLQAGLEIVLWKPKPSKTDPGGLYTEIPVEINMNGTYHNLGQFFSKVSSFERIVNVADINIKSITKASDADKNIVITFTAITFASVSEEDLKKAQKAKKGAPAKKTPPPKKE